MRKFSFFIIIIMLVVPVYLLIHEEKVEVEEVNENVIVAKKINEFKSDDEIIEIVRGENLTVDSKNLYYYNYNRYNKTAYLYKNISIGSTYKEVIEAFDLKEDYAVINVERFEGSLKIIESIPYEDDTFINNNYIDVSLIFGYIKKNNAWELLPYDEITNYINSSFVDEDVIVYMIDLIDEYKIVEDFNVSGISIEYYE